MSEKISQEAADLTALLLPIKSLKPFPGNPRQGDVHLISESLAKHGQYRPIVVRKQDKTILAGNHTFKAAKSLGWTHISAVVLDVTDEQAKRIVLADNRTSDLGDYVERSLAAVLGSLDDLSGTGFDDNDLLRMLSRMANVETFAEPLKDVAGHVRMPTDVVSPVITVGQMTMYSNAEAFAKWVETVEAPGDIPEWLSWPISEAPIKETEADAKIRTEAVVTDAVALDSGEEVEISGLKALLESSIRTHGNAVIVESLKVNGQYRPIVVNRSDMTVVVGQAVVDAAKSIGWKQIKVTYIEVSHEDAIKISLMDNRSTDLAWYDTKALAQMLMSVDDVVGTGFDAKSVQSVVDEAGLLIQHEIEAPMVSLRIRYRPQGIDWVWLATRADYDAWHANVTRDGRYSDDGVRLEIARRLRYPITELTKSQRL